MVHFVCAQMTQTLSNSMLKIGSLLFEKKKRIEKKKLDFWICDE
jgi:hypothetical protein